MGPFRRTPQTAPRAGRLGDLFLVGRAAAVRDRPAVHPGRNLEARRYAFKLLCIYTASGLGLLMTTSFLGLRRYLRQRRLEMPLEMASVWLTVGSLMIVALLFVCWLLPRPNAEYSITQVPFQVSSPSDLEASRHGWGNEGAQDKPQQAQSAGAANKEQEGRPGGTESEGRSGEGKPQDGEGQGKSPGGQQGDGNQPGGQAGEGKSSGGPSAGEGKSGKPIVRLTGRRKAGLQRPERRARARPTSGGRLETGPIRIGPAVLVIGKRTKGWPG